MAEIAWASSGNFVGVIPGRDHPNKIARTGPRRPNAGSVLAILFG